MTTWNDYKKKITSISKNEMDVIDMLSYLQSERIRQGISQQELANRTGMKQPQIARIERLDSVPSLTTLQRYANGLGLNLQLSVTELA